jgi:flagellar assembly factor FliW
VSLPAGLLGFESVKQWILTSPAEDAPFHWLKPPENPGLAFLLVPPQELGADYQPDIPDTDAAFLQLADAADALLFNIVTLHADGCATVNLKGPLVLNRRTGVGKQIVPLNAADYSTQHPVPTT